MIKEFRIYWRLRPYIKQLKELFKMRLSLNVIVQILMLLMQAYNQIGDLLPAKWKTPATLIMGIIQAVVALMAHMVNPDGSSAALPYTAPKKSQMPGMLLILGLMCLSVPAMAQDRIGFGGVGYFAPASPVFQGFAGMAIPIGDKAYSWTDMDFSIVKDGGQLTIAGQRLAYSIKSGIAYKLFAVKDWSVLGLGAPGLQTDGDRISAKLEYGLAIHKWIIKDKLGVMMPFTAETHQNLNTEKMETNFVPRLGLTFRF
jgi:hypothetical protein